MSTHILTRTVTQTECPWLYRDFHKGDLVWIYAGLTYGCVSPTGRPCSEEGPLKTPFFELPKDALEML